jgi:atypical dual specificity phosphatase
VTELGLSLERFGVAFGSRRVLTDLTLRIPPRGLHVLVGPVASGKSTLLRTLAGVNHAQPELRLRGNAGWDGKPLFEKHGSLAARIALVTQKARFFVDTVRENLVSALPNRAQLERAQQDAVIGRLLDESHLESLSSSLNLEAVHCSTAEQRHLAILRAVATDPDLLLADEPTAGVDGREAEALIAVLRREATRRAVILVTHHRRHAELAGGTTHLLVAGVIRESAPTATFSVQPGTELGRTFLRTGGCLDPAAGVVERMGPAREDESWHWPRGFYWVVPGEVGGVPRPGLLGDLQQDLLGLRRLGIRVVVGLEETQAVAAHCFATQGLEFAHFPLRDMEAPQQEAALSLCRFVADCVRAGKPVAFHCRAGLGRTGTLLACYLVQQGRSVAQAIETVRAINPLCIQSQQQVAFLKSLGESSIRH